MLGALMHSQGRIYAFDNSEKRLNNLKPRLKRSGLSNLFPQLIGNENDIKVKRLAGKIDRVLVDAPCSGLGTLRRNPDLKWRQSPQSIDELKHKQAAILSSASRLLKPGGRLVYATCSFLPEENQEIVEHFLNDNPAFHAVELFRIAGTTENTPRDGRIPATVTPRIWYRWFFCRRTGIEKIKRSGALFDRSSVCKRALGERILQAQDSLDMNHD